MTSILAINGSYRKSGMTDQALEVMLQTLREGGADTELVLLRDYPIEFCSNCRHCTQSTGDDPGECIHRDGMPALIEKIEAADAFILASPTNFSSATAVFKRFMERLVVYGDWPWQRPFPKFRRAKAKRKPSVVVSSSAAPGVMGRWMFHTVPQLKLAAKTIGGRTIGVLFTGLAGTEARQELSEKTRAKAQRLARRLLA